MRSNWKNSALEPLLRFLPALAGTVYPNLCPLCQEPMTGALGLWCAQCEASLVPISHPFCPKCGEPFTAKVGEDHLCGRCRAKPKPPFDRARAFGLYQGALAEAIRRLKFQAGFSLIHALSSLLNQAFTRQLSEQTYDLIIPVPLHRRRLRERGFNQAILIARELGRTRRLRFDSGNLVRVRDTRTQYGLTRSQRAENVKGAFALRRPDRIAGRQVLLVDDVYTTGATVKECARALKAAKAKRIDVLTLARAV